MASFSYRGVIPASKSLFNRALIVQSYFPHLMLQGESECEDVKHMRSAIRELATNQVIHCGDGGTTFRFMALRASRIPGSHKILGSPRLMQRPQTEIVKILRQLGVSAEIDSDGLSIQSQGWKDPNSVLQVNCSESSQYVSSLVLNSWLLDFDLHFELVGDKVSESYFSLTLDMLEKMGLRVQKTARGYLVKSGQRILTDAWTVESDVSSAFAVAAAGALNGEAIFINFPVDSLQPDYVFLEIFKRMGVAFQLTDSTLKVSKTGNLQPLEWNLSQSPDLFPVLAVLCSCAEGTSHLFGAPQLVQKESNRIKKVADLFDLLGIRYEVLPDGMKIHGGPFVPKMGVKVTFDPDQDHRMVMAACLFKLLGSGITIENPMAVNKSFPEFWSIMRMQP